MAGQSDPHLSIFSPSEVEFVAEDEIVEIVPNIRMEALNMICLLGLSFLERSKAQMQALVAAAICICWDNSDPNE
ncbi:hypothetical protein E2562_037288 [Oryza meyeriana var. granulata]|uniref:DNA replication complex GINS protein PSF2 N-terminal domain-containing protein n=1 Tax=Oryza meyeriana var. granulata TaxID=110450 RepID=A0A6G1E6T2_9ORYZ|nr:hypothetical protein E2562_037288 [Oryza meyeriana var. granulata]